MTTIRIATRRSALALAQVDLVCAALAANAPDVHVEVVPMSTRGDEDMRSFAEVGGRGIFAHDLERALVAGEVDAVVHSSKDLALEDRDELRLAAWLPRANPRDALVMLTGAQSLDELPRGAVVATSSARRRSSLALLREDIVASPIRGNVATRIESARDRGDDAVMLARAGLDRLALTSDLDVVDLDVDDVVPEAGQGAIVVQVRAADEHGVATDTWRSVDDMRTRRVVSLERELARLVGGGCDRPVGVHVDIESGRLRVFTELDDDRRGRRISISLVGLELAPLVSVSSARDIDDAVVSIAPKLVRLVDAELAEASA